MLLPIILIDWIAVLRLYDFLSNYVIVDLIIGEAAIITYGIRIFSLSFIIFSILNILCNYAYSFAYFFYV